MVWGMGYINKDSLHSPLYNTKPNSQLSVMPALHCSPTLLLSLFFFLSYCHCHKSAVVWTKIRAALQRTKSTDSVKLTHYRKDDPISQLLIN